jgi:hypothetical protein
VDRVIDFLSVQAWVILWARNAQIGVRHDRRRM